MARAFAPHAEIAAHRYLIVPCEAEAGLAVIWDRLEEQVIDVIDARLSARIQRNLANQFEAPLFAWIGALTLVLTGHVRSLSSGAARAAVMTRRS